MWSFENMDKTISRVEREFILEKIIHQARGVLPVRAREWVDGEIFEESQEVGKSLVFKLKTQVLASDLGEIEKAISYPSTWWQMFKDSYFPRWLLKRFPIIYKKQTWKIKGWATYPHFDKIIPGERAVFKMVESLPETTYQPMCDGADIKY